jgi:predicted HicB family RNase H-like nuclease
MNAMNTMTYKGYTAVVELDQEDGSLFGRVMGLRDVITFEAETVPRAIEEFHNSIDSYLELCASRGEEPEKPYSGNFLVRIDPELHRELARYAAQRDSSINAVVTDTIAELIQRAADLPPRRVQASQARSVSAAEPRDPKTGLPILKRTRSKGA